jgi:hypothetical protein
MEKERKGKKMPYGVTDFKELVEKGYAYVDKTRFIEVLENEHTPYHVFIRPRKFGKSLFLSTLYYYHSITEADQFQQLFGNLYIGHNPTPDKNMFAVLNFNFSNIDTNSEEHFRHSFENRIEENIDAFFRRYLNTFNNVQDCLDRIKNKGTGALDVVFGAAGACNVRLFVIVDEYDHFANDLIAMGNTLGKDVYEKMVKANGLVRDFYEGLKIGTSFCLKRIFITGISPVMLNDLTSGFNIADNLTLKRKYNEIMGFTHQEVLQLIEETNVDTTLINVNLENYYNGYKFHEDGVNKVYNPTMIMGYLKQIIDEGVSPKDLVDENLKTDYNRLKNLIKNQNNKDKLIDIAKNNGTKAHIVKQFSIDAMYQNEYFVSLLLYMGLLTIDKYYRGVHYLKIPNYSIQTLYWDYLAKIIAQDSDVQINPDQLDEAIYSLAYDGKLQPYVDYLSKNFFNLLSNRDLIHFDEKYIKLILLSGFLLNNTLTPRSEYEIEHGYIDVFLQRNALDNATFEWVWELKYVKATDPADVILAKTQEAVTQLNKYKQAKLFLNRTDVKFAAVVFIGKDKYQIQEV